MRKRGKEMFFQKRKRKVIGVEGMHCDNCALRIKKALEELTDVEKVNVDLKKKMVIVFNDNTVDELLLQKVIEDLGYTVTGMKEIH